MTALHLMAQWLLVGDQSIVTKTGVIEYSDGIIEYSNSSWPYRFDVGGQKPDGELFIIEIKVSHSVDDTKAKFFPDNKIHALEIDLSDVHSDISADDLRKILLSDVNRQRSLFDPTLKDRHAPKPDESSGILWLIGGLLGAAVLAWLKNRFCKKRRKHTPRRASTRYRN